MSFLSTVTRQLVANRWSAWAARSADWFLGGLELPVLAHYHGEGEIALLRRLRHEDQFHFKPSEALVLYNFARAWATWPGDFVEVGVFRGTSAIVISEALLAAGVKKQLLLFDTFEGIPHTGARDRLYRRGQFKSRGRRSNLEIVRARMLSYGQVQICQGLFPTETGGVLAGRRLAFAHLDVDVYESTLASLRAIYGRLEPGGVVVAHDYGQAEGVRAAFDEFFVDKPEAVVPLPMSQCFFVKR